MAKRKSETTSAKELAEQQAALVAEQSIVIESQADIIAKLVDGIHSNTTALAATWKAFCEGLAHTHHLLTTGRPADAERALRALVGNAAELAGGLAVQAAA